VTVAAGGSSSPSFYYQDTKAGAPTLTATASGYTDATQTETVNAAPLATVTVSPSSTQLRVSTSNTFSAEGGDRYGNLVPVTPTWSVSPMLGTFSPNPANPTSFSAATIGTGTITATAGGVTGTASISVLPKKRRSGTPTTNLARAGTK